MHHHPQPAMVKPADPARSAAIILCVAAGLLLIGLVSKSWIVFSASGSDRSAHIGPIGAERCVGGVCIDMPTQGMPGDVELMMMVGLIAGFASVALAGWLGGGMLAGKRDKLPPVRLAQVAFAIATGAFVFFVIRAFSEGGSGIGPGWAMFPGIGGAITAGVGLKKLSPFLPSGHVIGGPGFRQPGVQPYGQPPPAGGYPAGYPGYGQPGPQPYGQPAAQPYGQPPAQPMQPYGQQPSQPYGQPPAQPSQPMQPYGQQPSQPHGQPAAHYGQPPQHGQPAAQQSQPMQPHAHPPQAAAPSCPRCGQPLQFVAQYQRWFCAREQQYV